MVMGANDSSALDSAFLDASALIWRAAVAAEVDPNLSHIEVMFGSGSAPWDGVQHRQVTYYLSSHRATDFVLLSFNACMALCTDEFPRCYRVTYGKQTDFASDRGTENDPREDLSVVADAPNNSTVRQCGRSFPKSLGGVQNALRMARYAHLISLAKERHQWATLVEFSADNESYRILHTWPNTDLFMPNVRVDALRRELAANSVHYSTSAGTQVVVQLVAGLILLLFLLALIGFVSDAIKKYKRSRRSLRDAAPQTRKPMRETKII